MERQRHARIFFQTGWGRLSVDFRSLAAYPNLAPVPRGDHSGIAKAELSTPSPEQGQRWFPPASLSFLEQ
jgi:hypothetical protein